MRVIGCEGLHFAKVLTDNAQGVTYDTPIAVPSLIAVDIKDNKETVEFYSDNKVEQVLNQTSSKEVTLELGYMDKEIQALITGNKYEEGVYVEIPDAVPSNVCILFKAPLSQSGFRFVALYKGVLSKEESNYKTKESSIEGQTVKLAGTFMGTIFDGRPHMEVDDNDVNLTDKQRTMIANWFTSVPKYEKTTVAQTTGETETKKGK